MLSAKEWFIHDRDVLRGFAHQWSWLAKFSVIHHTEKAQNSPFERFSFKRPALLRCLAGGCFGFCWHKVFLFFLFPVPAWHIRYLLLRGERFGISIFWTNAKKPWNQSLHCSTAFIAYSVFKNTVKPMERAQLTCVFQQFQRQVYSTCSMPHRGCLLRV